MRLSSKALATLLPLLFSTLAGADPARLCPISQEGATTTARVAGRLFSSGTGTIQAVASTRDCLSCHDGTVARKTSLPTAQFASREFRAGDHPVDMIYPAMDPKFRPLAEVERALPLDAGRVTCTTCHSGSNPADSYLTVPNFRSGLCLSCHVK